MVTMETQLNNNIDDIFKIIKKNSIYTFPW